MNTRKQFWARVVSCLPLLADLMVSLVREWTVKSYVGTSAEPPALSTAARPPRHAHAHAHKANEKQAVAEVCPRLGEADRRHDGVDRLENEHVRNEDVQFLRCRGTRTKDAVQRLLNVDCRQPNHENQTTKLIAEQKNPDGNDGKRKKKTIEITTACRAADRPSCCTSKDVSSASGWSKFVLALSFTGRCERSL